MPFYQGKTEFGEWHLGAPQKWTTSITKEAIKGDILMSVRAPVGPVNFATNHICIGRGLAAIRAKGIVMKEYLFYLLRYKEGEIKGSGGAVFDSITKAQIEKIQIPLPPLPVQEEIVSEIGSYQKIIDGAKQVVENYKPRIDIDPEWEMVELADVIKLSSGSGLTTQNMTKGPFPVYGGNGINGYHDQFLVDEPTIVIGRVGAYCGSIHITESKSWITDNGLFVTNFLKEVNIKYLAQILRQLNFNQYSKVGGQPSISQKTVTSIQAPIPSKEIQDQIVKKIEQEEQLIIANKLLIDLFGQKIKDRIAKVWGE